MIKNRINKLTFQEKGVAIFTPLLFLIMAYYLPDSIPLFSFLFLLIVIAFLVGRSNIMDNLLMLFLTWVYALLLFLGFPLALIMLIWEKEIIYVCLWYFLAVPLMLLLPDYFKFGNEKEDFNQIDLFHLSLDQVERNGDGDYPDSGDSDYIDKIKLEGVD